MTQFQLPDIGEVAERIRTSRDERAWLKKLFRLLQEAKSFGCVPTNSHQREEGMDNDDQHKTTKAGQGLATLGGCQLRSTNASRDRHVRMSRPPGKCPACDQAARDVAAIERGEVPQ